MDTVLWSWLVFWALVGLVIWRIWRLSSAGDNEWW